MRKRSTPLVAAAVLVALAAAGPRPAARAQVQVDGRVVQVKPAGGCPDLLVTSSQRYVDCGNGTVWDLATDLLWLKHGACGRPGLPQGRGTWLEAHAAATATADGLVCGSTELTDGSQPGDWRLPTLDEWIVTVDHAITLGCLTPTLTGATGVACDDLPPMTPIVVAAPYWTGTGVATDPAKAWTVALADATFAGIAKNETVDPPFIWPVRPAGSTAPEGVAWIGNAPIETAADLPCQVFGTGTSRSFGCGNGTARDTVTGLVWMSNSRCFAELGWPQAMEVVTHLQHGMCGLTDDSQPGDWRLPTREEWEATIAPAALGCSPAITDAPGTGCVADGPSPFVIPDATYWSATTRDSDPHLVYYARLSDGAVSTLTKTSLARLWAVRSKR